MAAMQRTVNLATILVAIVALGSCGRSLAKVETFTFYLHDRFVDPKTAVKVASASGNLNESAAFGDVVVVDSPLRKGIERESLLIGAAGGLLAFLKDDMNFITGTFELKIPELDYEGSIAASGRFSFKQPSWTLIITGGVGSFFGVTGYFTVSLPDPNPAGYIINWFMSLH